MMLRSKSFYVGKRKCVVKLMKEGGIYLVKVDEDVYKETANELFACQAFNAI